MRKRKPIGVTAPYRKEGQQPKEKNFCERCGKRLGKEDWDVHTCTPPKEKNT